MTLIATVAAADVACLKGTKTGLLTGLSRFRVTESFNYLFKLSLT